MDFYYAMTNYQLLECILHKMHLNRSDHKKVMYVSSFLVNNQPKLVESLQKSNIFDAVEYYEETIFSHEDGINLEKEIERISKDVEQKYGKIVSSADHLYIGQDLYALGLYLVHKGINYIYFEDGCGSYTNEDVLHNIIKKENKNRFEILKKLKLVGKSKYAVEVYCDFDHQKRERLEDKCIDFSIKKILKEMKPNEIDILLRMYGFNRKNQKSTGKNKDLLLTWHYTNMNMLSLEEQYLFFSLLTDYFHDDDSTLYIKPHPSDRQPDYKKVFKDAIILEGLMPSELLPYCIGDVFENGITNWSTSVFGLKDIIHNIVNFDKRIDETYVDFDKYYAIVLYLKERKTKEKVTLVCEEFNEIQLERLFTKYFSNYKKYYVISDKENPDTDNIHLVNEKTSKDDKKVIELMGSFQTDHYIHIAKEYQSGEKKNEYVGLYNMDDIHLDSKKELKYSGYQITITNKTATEIIPLLCEEKRIEKNKYEKELLEKEKKIEKMQNKIDSYCYDMNALYNSTSWKMTKPFRKTVDFIRHFKKK